jgi:choline dehydrogenase-like flavoprotein
MDCLSEIRHFFAPTREFLDRDKILNWSLRMRVRTPGHDEPTDGKLFIGSEQALNPSSTITLSADKDRFGLRRVRMNWQLSEVDVRTIQLATLRFGEAMAENSVGRVRILDWLDDESPAYLGTGGHHHMCTTRMASSRKSGVVDQDLKVFGLDNLYVAGSSSFGTGGHANPTLTIVQMALRLADHLST